MDMYKTSSTNTNSSSRSTKEGSISFINIVVNRIINGKYHYNHMNPTITVNLHDLLNGLPAINAAHELELWRINCRQKSTVLQLIQKAVVVHIQNVVPISSSKDWTETSVQVT